MINQASEDVRNHISRSICHEAYSSEYEELTGVAKWTHDELVDEIIMPAINALIRTEKLKLLAEVRERVIGEDVELNSFEIPMFEAEFVITSVTQQNNLRADQRVSLAKLEANQ